MTTEATQNDIPPTFKSTILWESGPLRLKSQISGKPKLQGVFRLHDQEGFPIDMTYELAKGKGWEVDWVEALVDAARQSVDKYKGVLHEIEMLEPDKESVAITLVTAGITRCEGEGFCQRAEALYQRMRNSHV